MAGEYSTLLDNNFMSHFSGHFRGQKSRGPLKMSLEMGHKVIVPTKKNYVPQFLKQQDINSYLVPDIKIICHCNTFLYHKFKSKDE